MIPILMQDETTVGFLADALSCVVTEEPGGVFELSLTYPVTGKMFPEIAIDRFVKAKPNDTADLQLFRIYEVSKPMNGIVTVNAEHVSYALAHFPVIEANITGTATQAINELLSDVTDVYDYFDKTNPFCAATTDMDTIADSPDPNYATKVWRWNMGGLGFSPNGYSGPFTTAITADGEIVADFITAGTLTANIIHAGILTSVNGRSSFNLESGLLKSSNIEVTGGTIRIGNSDYYTYIANGSIAQHMTSGGGLIGGLVPIGVIEDNHITEGLYCEHGTDGVGIYERQADSTFKTLALFHKTKSYINTPLQLIGDLTMVGDLSLAGKLSIGGTISFGLAATNNLNFDGENGIALGGSTAFRLLSGSLALGIEGRTTKYYGEDLIPTGAVNLGSSSSKWGVVYAARYEVPGGLITSGDGALLIGTSLSDGIAIGSASGSSVTPYLMVEKDRVISNGNMYAPKFVVNSVEALKTNITEAGSVLDAIRNSRIYTYNLISETPASYGFGYEPESDDTDDIDGAVVAQSEKETLNGASVPEVSDHTSTGFVIGRETPDAVLSEDGAHIDLYAMAALN